MVAFSLDGRSIAKESVTNGEYSSFFFFPISLSFRKRKPFSYFGLINLESKSKIQKEAGKGQNKKEHWAEEGLKG